MKFSIYSLIFVLLMAGCQQTNSETEETQQQANDNQAYMPQDYVQLTHPEWSKNATIYEVNIRQFTPEGTFKAFEAHLPRLKAMGIDILWLMPIHPIGEKNRKGTLGSYYSVKDYYGINPEFGTMDDFKRLVQKIHEMDMYVIIDWVANHSAWDNALVIEHPEWYSKTPEGNFQPTPWWDWDDIIDFDYDKPELRQYMTEALKYWVREADIDGYRCDVAGYIPVDFWDNVRKELDAIKSVFMLAEWESRDLHKNAFDMTYGWRLWEIMHEVTTKNTGVGKLVVYLAEYESTFPPNAIKMNFTDNHDKNSWEGSQYDHFGDGLEACIVMSTMVCGMPLVYSGQEAGLDRSLRFFEKDEIEWKQHSNTALFTRLFALKHENPALWNGKYGGRMQRIYNDQPNAVISFAREKNGDKVITVINFSDKAIDVKLGTEYHTGSYTDWFSDTFYTVGSTATISMPPWGYSVLVKK